jgi:hypothetical protein
MARGRIPAAQERPAFRQAIRKRSRRLERDGVPGGARVVGHATRTDVAARSRFGRGARHRTIRLRVPPASGARRLPALHLNPRSDCRRADPLPPCHRPASGGRPVTGGRPDVTVSVTNVNVKATTGASSLRGAKRRNNPDLTALGPGQRLDCFAPLAMTAFSPRSWKNPPRRGSRHGLR